MFRNRNYNTGFADPCPVLEQLRQTSDTPSGTEVTISLGVSSKKIPTPEEYRLSVLLAAGVKLDPVSCDISTDGDVLLSADAYFNESNAK